MRVVVYVSQDGQFALTEDQGCTCFIEVLCGGFARYGLEMQLNADEIGTYSAGGPYFLLGLAY